MSTNDSNSAIYERLVVLEIKVDKVAKDTVDVVTAFRAAQGAFTVLEWIAKAAKPIIWVCGIIAALSLLAQDFRK
jgi:predicted CoA-binding protein